MWNGKEHSTDYEASIGTQSVHSPSNAAASYTSYWWLNYLRPVVLIEAMPRIRSHSSREDRMRSPIRLTPA